MKFKPVNLIAISMLAFLVYCSSPQPMVKADAKMMSSEMVSYEKQLYPIMQRSCTPCHFPDKGRKQMLDTYETTKEYIDDIIKRISLAQDHKDFMPFKMKRQPLSEDEIMLFKNWAAQGMAK